MRGRICFSSSQMQLPIGNANDGAFRRPLGLRPIVRRNKVHVMSCVEHTPREAPQIRFRAAALSIANALVTSRTWRAERVGAGR